MKENDIEFASASDPFAAVLGEEAPERPLPADRWRARFEAAALHEASHLIVIWYYSRRRAMHPPFSGVTLRDDKGTPNGCVSWVDAEVAGGEEAISAMILAGLYGQKQLWGSALTMADWIGHVSASASDIAFSHDYKVLITRFGKRSAQFQTASLPLLQAVPQTFWAVASELADLIFAGQGISAAKAAELLSRHFPPTTSSAKAPARSKS